MAQFRDPFDDYRSIYPKGMGDWAIVEDLAKANKVAPEEIGNYYGIKPPTFLRELGHAIPRGLGQMEESVGQLAQDMWGSGEPNFLQRHGREVIENHPSAINSLEDVANYPTAALGLGAGTMASFIGPSLIPRTVGAGLQGARAASLARAAMEAGPMSAEAQAALRAAQAASAARIGAGETAGQIVVGGLPGYAGIRQAQEAEGSGHVGDPMNPWIAGGASLGVGWMERMGLQKMLGLGGGVVRRGERELAAEFGETPLRTAGRTAFRATVGEGGEEIPQNVLEQLASYKDPTTPENLRETAFGGVVGAMGGFAGGGPLGAYRAVQHAGMQRELAPYIDADKPTDLLNAMENRDYQAWQATADPNYVDPAAAGGAPGAVTTPDELAARRFARQQAALASAGLPGMPGGTRTDAPTPEELAAQRVAAQQAAVGGGGLQGAAPVASPEELAQRREGAQRAAMFADADRAAALQREEAAATAAGQMPGTGAAASGAALLAPKPQPTSGQILAGTGMEQVETDPTRAESRGILAGTGMTQVETRKTPQQPAATGVRYRNRAEALDAVNASYKGGHITEDQYNSIINGVTRRTSHIDIQRKLDAAIQETAYGEGGGGKTVRPGGEGRNEQVPGTEAGVGEDGVETTQAVGTETGELQGDEGKVEEEKKPFRATKHKRHGGRRTARKAAPTTGKVADTDDDDAVVEAAEAKPAVKDAAMDAAVASHVGETAGKVALPDEITRGLARVYLGRRDDVTVVDKKGQLVKLDPKNQERLNEVGRLIREVQDLYKEHEAELGSLVPGTNLTEKGKPVELGLQEDLGAGQKADLDKLRRGKPGTDPDIGKPVFELATGRARDIANAEIAANLREIEKQLGAKTVDRIIAEAKDIHLGGKQQDEEQAGAEVSADVNFSKPWTNYKANQNNPLRISGVSATTTRESHEGQDRFKGQLTNQTLYKAAAEGKGVWRGPIEGGIKGVLNHYSAHGTAMEKVIAKALHRAFTKGSKAKEPSVMFAPAEEVERVARFVGKKNLTGNDQLGYYNAQSNTFHMVLPEGNRVITKAKLAAAMKQMAEAHPQLKGLTELAQTTRTPMVQFATQAELQAVSAELAPKRAKQDYLPGFYDPKSRTIYLPHPEVVGRRMRGATPEVVLHETLHGALKWFIDENPNHIVVQKLGKIVERLLDGTYKPKDVTPAFKRVLDAIREAKGGKPIAGTKIKTDQINELMSYGMTHYAFGDALMQIDKSDMAPEKKSALSRLLSSFWDGIHNLLTVFMGGNPRTGAGNLATEIVNYTADLLSEVADFVPPGAAPATTMPIQPTPTTTATEVPSGKQPSTAQPAVRTTKPAAGAAARRAGAAPVAPAAGAPVAKFEAGDEVVYDDKDYTVVGANPRTGKVTLKGPKGNMTVDAEDVEFAEDFEREDQQLDEDGNPLYAEDVEDTSREGLELGVGMSQEAITNMLDQQLYGDLQNAGHVATKELFQNAVDAIKGEIEKGNITKGKVDIKIDDAKRTITVTDQGVGMKFEVVKSAFFTAGGTHKETKRPTGGFGIAKLQFLAAADKIHLETVRDGTKIVVDTTGNDVAHSRRTKTPFPAEQIKRYKTDDPNGTKVILTLPKERADADGTMVPIEMPYYWIPPRAIEKSPIFENVEVNYDGKPVNIGAKFPAQDFTPIAEVKFKWGTARVMVSNEQSKTKEGHVLVNGVWQFDVNIKPPSDRYEPNIPYEVYINLEPNELPTDDPSKSAAQAGNYPVAPNRQDFSPAAKKDMERLLKFVGQKYGHEVLLKDIEGYGHLKSVDANGKITDKQRLTPPPTAAQLGKGLNIPKNVQMEVRDGKLYIAGKVVPELTKEEMANFKPTDLAEFKIDQSLLDPEEILIHESMQVKNDKDEWVSPTEYGTAKFGRRFGDYLHNMGKLAQQTRNFIADLPGYAALKDVPYGLMLSASSGGYTTLGTFSYVPFQSVMLNPVTAHSAFEDITQPDIIASSMVSTLIHEAVHLNARNHDPSDFINKLQALGVKINNTDPYATPSWTNQFTDLITENKDIYDHFNELLGEPDRVRVHGRELKGGNQRGRTNAQERASGTGRAANAAKPAGVAGNEPALRAQERQPAAGRRPGSRRDQTGAALETGATETGTEAPLFATDIESGGGPARITDDNLIDRLAPVEGERWAREQRRATSPYSVNGVRKAIEEMREAVGPDADMADVVGTVGGVIYGAGGYNRYNLRPDGTVQPIPSSFSNKEKLAAARAALAGPLPRELLAQFKPGDAQGAMGTAVAAGMVNDAIKPGEIRRGHAQPVRADIMQQHVPPGIAKLLRGDGNARPGSVILKQALNKIALLGPREVRGLARTLSALMPLQGIILKVDDTDTTVQAHGSVKLGPGMPELTLYTAGGRTGLSYKTVLHEVIHAIVGARYHSMLARKEPNIDLDLGTIPPNADPALKQFIAVWREFRRHVGGKNLGYPALQEMVDYVIESPDEFLTYSLTSSEFQQFLASIPYKGTTLWQAFKDWVKMVLGQPTGTMPSWLDAALLASNAVVDGMAQDDPDFSRYLAINKAIEAHRQQPEMLLREARTNEEANDQPLYATAINNGGVVPANPNYTPFAPTKPWLEDIFRLALGPLDAGKSHKLASWIDNQAESFRKKLGKNSPWLASKLGYLYVPFNVSAAVEKIVQDFKKGRHGPTTVAHQFALWLTNPSTTPQQVMEAFDYMDNPGNPTTLPKHLQYKINDAREAMENALAASSQEVRNIFDPMSPSERLTYAVNSNMVLSTGFGIQEGKLTGAKPTTVLRSVVETSPHRASGKYYIAWTTGADGKRIVDKVIHEDLLGTTTAAPDMSTPYIFVGPDAAASRKSGQPHVRLRPITTAAALMRESVETQRQATAAGRALTLQERTAAAKAAETVANSFVNTVAIMANAVSTRKLTEDMVAAGRAVRPDGTTNPDPKVFDTDEELLDHVNSTLPADKQRTEINVTDAADQEAKSAVVSAVMRMPGNWVRVPASAAYGELAGKIIEGPLWSRIMDAMNSDPVINSQYYNRAMGIFKKGKTVYNPATAATNIMSNFTLAFMNNISFTAVAQGMQLYARYTYAPGTLTEDQLRVMSEFHRSGATLGDFSTTEIKQIMYKAMADATEVGGSKVGFINSLAQWTHYENSVRQGIVELAKRTGTRVDERMTEFYALGDNMFRLSAFISKMGELQREQPQLSHAEMVDMAGTYAKKAFLDYDIDARAVKWLRQTALPFFSWPYAFAGVLGKIAKEQPWKIATLALAYTMVTTAMNAAMGGDDDDEERKRRERENLADRTWFGAAKQVALGQWGGRHHYFDAARWFSPTPIDFREQPNGFMGLHSWPLALTPSNPAVSMLMTAFGYDPYTGDPLDKDTDTAFAKVAKRIGKVAGTMTPTWAGERLMGPKPGLLGHEPDVASHYLRLFAAPISSIDEAESRKGTELDIKRETRAFDTLISNARRDSRLGKIPYDEFAETIEALRERKAERIRELREML